MHYSDQDLIAYLDGEVSVFRRGRMGRHLRACWDCRTRLSSTEQAILSLSKEKDSFIGQDSDWIIEARQRLRDGMRRVEATVGVTPRSRWRWNLHAVSWAATLACLLVVAGWRYWSASKSEEILPAETVAQGLAVEERLYRYPVEQVFALKVSQLRPAAATRGATLHIWSDAQTGRFASRLTGVEGDVRQALWKPSAGTEYLYRPAQSRTVVQRTAHSQVATPLSSLSDGSLDAEGLEQAFVNWLENRNWRPISLTADLSVWSKRDGATLTAERLTQSDGSVLIRITGRRTERSVVAVLSVDLDARDFRPRLQTIRFETPERSVEFQLAATVIEPIPSSRLAAIVFQPRSGTPDLPVPAAQTEPAPAPPAPVVESPAANSPGSIVEAAAVLHRAGACLGSPVEIESGDGTVRVRGKTSGPHAGPEVWTTAAPLQDVLSALSRLRAMKTVAGANLYRRDQTSSTLLQHAAALREIADSFSPQETAAMTSPQWAIAGALVTEHVNSALVELRALSVDYRPARSAQYAARAWRESASTVYDKAILLAEMAVDNRAADTAALAQEIEMELVSIASILRAGNR